MSEAEQRRPTSEDFPLVLEMVAQGSSLRAACRKLGLHCPSTHTAIRTDVGLSEQYARALEMRADCQQEEALDVARAAATGRPLTIEGEEVSVDAQGARVLLDAIKWSSARMAPKTAPVQRVSHSFEELTDEELDARIAAKLSGSDANDGEP